MILVDLDLAVFSVGFVERVTSMLYTGSWCWWSFLSFYGT